MLDLGIGERRERRVAHEVGEGLGEKRIFVGSHRHRRRARRRAGAVDELARPTRGGGGADAFEDRAPGQKRPRIEGAFLAERARRALLAESEAEPGHAQRAVQALPARERRPTRAQSKSSTFHTPASRRSLTECPPWICTDAASPEICTSRPS